MTEDLCDSIQHADIKGINFIDNWQLITTMITVALILSSVTYPPLPGNGSAQSRGWKIGLRETYYIAHVIWKNHQLLLPSHMNMTLICIH